jgi:hypothetical protein
VKAIRISSSPAATKKMIVELKAVSGDLGASEEQQLRNYRNLVVAVGGR